MTPTVSLKPLHVAMTVGCQPPCPQDHPRGGRGRVPDAQVGADALADAAADGQQHFGGGSSSWIWNHIHSECQWPRSPRSHRRVHHAAPAREASYLLY